MDTIGSQDSLITHYAKMSKKQSDTWEGEFFEKCQRLFMENIGANEFRDWIQENFVPREESFKNAVKELNNFADK